MALKNLRFVYFCQKNAQNLSFLEMNLQKTPSSPYWIVVVSLFAVILVGMFVSNFLALVMALPFVGFDLGKLMLLLESPTSSPANRPIFMLIQALTSVGTFVITPILFYKFYAKDFLEKPKWEFASKLFVLAALLVLVSMPFNSMVVKWNEAVQLPDSLSQFELWASQKEQLLKKLTLFLVDFDSIYEFLIGLVVVAVVPAIGEEFLFRGMLQGFLQKTFRNPHAAIWVAGFLFSAFHLQFYGLVPRMLLGVLFGYFYFWSGNLAVPVVAHFVNNGFTLLLMYLFKLEMIDIDIDSPETAPWEAVLVSVCLISVLLWGFWKKTSKNLSNPTNF